MCFKKKKKFECLYTHMQLQTVFSYVSYKDLCCLNLNQKSDMLANFQSITILLFTSIQKRKRKSFGNARGSFKSKTSQLDLKTSFSTTQGRKAKEIFCKSHWQNTKSNEQAKVHQLLVGTPKQTKGCGSFHMFFC